MEEKDLILIEGEFYLRRGSSVYQFDPLTDTVGKYVGKLLSDGETIDKTVPEPATAAAPAPAPKAPAARPAKVSVTEYMLNLHDELLDEKSVEDSTAVAYIRNLVTLNGGKGFNNLAFLRNVDEIMGRMEGYALSTKKNLLATITSVLSIQPSPIYQRLYETYSQKLKAAHTTLDEERGDTMKPTEKEMENWVKWEDVTKTRDQLVTKALKLLKDTAGMTTNDKSQEEDLYSVFLQSAVLSLYTYLPPRRNMDYQKMVLVARWKEDMPQDKNYFDVAGKRFIFNRYKTYKTSGQQIVPVPAGLLAALTPYLRVHPLNKMKVPGERPFLVNYKGSPLTASNGMTRILNKTFGKKVGSSLLRHSYLTDKYGAMVGEGMRDAEAMAHSSSVQRTYIRDPAAFPPSVLEL